jgi:hypothetical protein
MSCPSSAPSVVNEGTSSAGGEHVVGSVGHTQERPASERASTAGVASVMATSSATGEGASRSTEASPLDGDGGVLRRRGVHGGVVGDEDHVVGGRSTSRRPGSRRPERAPRRGPRSIGGRSSSIERVRSRRGGGLPRCGGARRASCAGPLAVVIPIAPCARFRSWTFTRSPTVTRLPKRISRPSLRRRAHRVRLRHPRPPRRPAGAHPPRLRGHRAALRAARRGQAALRGARLQGQPRLRPLRP